MNCTYVRVEGGGGGGAGRESLCIGACIWFVLPETHVLDFYWVGETTMCNCNQNGGWIKGGDDDIAQKMKFSIKDIFSKCDQILSFLRIWSQLLRISLMENFIFCTVSYRFSSDYDMMMMMSWGDDVINAAQTDFGRVVELHLNISFGCQS